MDEVIEKRPRLTKSERKSRIQKTYSFIILLIVTIIWVFPLIYMIGNAFKVGDDFALDPSRIFPSPGMWTYENFSGYIVRDGEMDNFIYWIINSLWSSAASVILTLIMNMLTAYAVVFVRFKGKNLFMKLVMIWYAVPGVIGTAASFSIYTAMLKASGAVNSELGTYFFIYGWMIIPGCTGIFNMLLMRNFFASIPVEIIDSAKSDGATSWQVFRKIILPLSKSTCMLIVLFVFVGAWNNLQGAQLLLSVTSNRHFETLTVALTGYTGGSSTGIGIKMSSAFFAMIPSTIVFLCTQNKMIDGLATTGIKQ